MSWADGVYAVWALVVALAIVLWWLSVSGHAAGRVRIARLGSAVRRLTNRPALRVALLLVWMWVGWHLFAR